MARNKKIRATKVELESTIDLARYAYGFGHENCEVFASAERNGICVFSPGEHVGKSMLLYCVTLGKGNAPRALRYSSDSGKDSASVSDHADASDKSSISVFSLDLGNFDFGKGAKSHGMSMRFVEVGGFDDLVRGTIRKAMNEENIENIYVFWHGGKTVACAFDIFESLENEHRILYFNRSKTGINAGFARYDYSNDTVSMSDSAGEHSYMYAKIIHLKKPFEFFRGI